MTLENLVGKGLREESAHRQEIQRLLAKAQTRLADASSAAISHDSRFDLAYEAILQLGLCALRANGYRPDSKGGHHVTALQTLTKSIGYPREKVRLIDEFRRQRAISLYDGSFEPTEQELEALLIAGTELNSFLVHWLQENHPELAPE